MWLWGQDVRNPEGNLLLRYGFEKLVSPISHAGRSAYKLQLPRMQVILWAFGLFLGHQHWGSLFIKRFQFAPCLADAWQLEHMVWEPAALAGMSTPQPEDDVQLAQLLQLTLNWIADYETWISNTQSLDYRRQCVANWPKVRTPPEHIIPAWKQLSADLNKQLLASHRHRVHD
jgi:hypothetical protein